VTYTDLALFTRLFEKVKPYWLHLAGIISISLLAAPLALLTPLPLKIAVDSVLGSEPLPGFLTAPLPAAATRSDTIVLALAAGLLVSIALLSRIQQLGSSLLSTYTGEKLALSFRTQLFHHVQRLSLSYHDSQGTSDSIYRIQYDASAVRQIAIGSVIPLIAASVTVASMVYVTLRLDWQLALVALAVSPILFFLIRV
jgi:ATP-binding cassette subfamily B protein